MITRFSPFVNDQNSDFFTVVSALKSFGNATCVHPPTSGGSANVAASGKFVGPDCGQIQITCGAIKSAAATPTDKYPAISDLSGHVTRGQSKCAGRRARAQPPSTNSTR